MTAKTFKKYVAFVALFVLVVAVFLSTAHVFHEHDEHHDSGTCSQCIVFHNIKSAIFSVEVFVCCTFVLISVFSGGAAFQIVFSQIDSAESSRAPPRCGLVLVTDRKV